MDTVIQILPLVSACFATASMAVVLVLYRRERAKYKRNAEKNSQETEQLNRRLQDALDELKQLKSTSAIRQFLLSAAEEELLKGDAPVGLIAFSKQNALQLLGYKASETLHDWFSAEMSANPADFFKAKCPDETAMIAVHSKGEKHWIELNKTESEEILFYTAKDMTATVNLRNMETYEQRYDKLTGLYNQSTFMENAKKLFAEKQLLGTTCVLVFRTEYINGHNSGLGHKKIEEYIKACAAVLNKHAASGMFSRYSNDEFYGILYGYPNRQSAQDDLKQLWADMVDAVDDLDLSNEAEPKINIGVSWYPEHSENIDELISYSNFCVYIARKNRTYGIEVFDRKVFQRDGYLLHGRAGFAEMVEKRMVRFAFQPIVDVSIAKIYGYELLMRPQHKSMRNIGDVINLAVAQGQTHAIEKLTWFEGLKAFSALVEAGKVRYDAKLFVNSIGGTCLTEAEAEAFTEQYYDYLKNIVTEITESQQESEEYTVIKRSRAAQWGAQIAIDDYGTGYNSELSLLFFRPSIVKVDIAFVQNIDKDIDKQVLFKNLIHYAKAKHTEIVRKIKNKTALEAVLG